MENILSFVSCCKMSVKEGDQVINPLEDSETDYDAELDDLMDELIETKEEQIKTMHELIKTKEELIKTLKFIIAFELGCLAVLILSLW